MSDFGPPTIPGTGMGGGNPMIAKILEQGDAQRAEAKQAEAGIVAARQREDAARTAQATALAPKRAELRASLGAAPQPPETKPLPEAPKAPMVDPKEMGDTLSLVTALAAISGALSRKPLTAALNNFTAGVHGYVQGKNEIYRDSLKEFEQNLKKASTENDQVWKKYEAASKKHGTDIQALQNEIQIIAAETQSPIDQALAAKGDIVSLMKLHETSNQNYTKVLENVARITETQRAHEATEQHRRTQEVAERDRLTEMKRMHDAQIAKMGGTPPAVPGASGDPAALDPKAKAAQAKQVTALSHDLQKANLPVANTVMLDAEAAVKDPKVSAFLTGPESALPDASVSKEVRAGRQAIAKLFNITLKDRSGAAVTNQELERLKAEFGQGLFKRQDQLEGAITRARAAINDHYRTVAAGYGPAVLQAYNDNLTGVGGKPVIDLKAAPSGGKGDSGQPKTAPGSEPTATGPNGERVVYRDGKWQPLP